MSSLFPQWIIVGDTHTNWVLVCIDVCVSNNVLDPCKCASDDVLYVDKAKSLELLFQSVRVCVCVCVCERIQKHRSSSLTGSRKNNAQLHSSDGTYKKQFPPPCSVFRKMTSVCICLYKLSLSPPLPFLRPTPPPHHHLSKSPVSDLAHFLSFLLSFSSSPLGQGGTGCFSISGSTGWREKDTGREREREREGNGGCTSGPLPQRDRPKGPQSGPWGPAGGGGGL